MNLTSITCVERIQAAQKDRKKKKKKKKTPDILFTEQNTINEKGTVTYKLQRTQDA